MSHSQRPGSIKSMLAVLFLALILIPVLTASAAGPNHPPEDDPSAFTGPDFSDLPEGLPHANEGAFEGGAMGDEYDAWLENVLQKEEQRDGGVDLFGIYNVPTNGPPSPLFGAQPFTAKLLRFEEFGRERMDTAGYLQPTDWQSLPTPLDPRSFPDSAALDSFLQQDIWPAPTKFANELDLNPWQAAIEDFLGRPLNLPPAEGRPPGLGWSHQRWEEFPPAIYFQTAQTGARTNSGFRDDKQLHRFQKGEFGPGGLYYSPDGVRLGTTDGIEVRLHPDLPVQDSLALWTFDGTFPPKLLMARYGEPVLMRHYNALPIDVSSNRGFGLHTITTHEHNGHNPAESDGYTTAFFFPGQYYDYRWPMALAGHDSINSDAKDRRAGYPLGPEDTRCLPSSAPGQGCIPAFALQLLGKRTANIPGDWRETMSTHWFHDHMLDFTAQNVYKGNAAMMNYYSSLDRGNERVRDGVNIALPSGDALAWGNRDYDVNLMLAEKAWDQEGQLWFNPFNIDGFIGDVMTVNWVYKPHFDVRARNYRFRILNASVSRYFKLALVHENGTPVDCYMVANDGNIMEHAVFFEGCELPMQGIAERYDIVVDFGDFEPGDKIYMVNLQEQFNGRGTDRLIPLEDVVSGAYKAELLDEDGDGIADRWVNGDPVVGKFLEFRVHEFNGNDRSIKLDQYVAGKRKMIPLNRPTEEELANALHRTFEFERQPTDEKPWVIETDGGKGFSMDPRRISAASTSNSSQVEVWRLINSGTWSHPIHIHFEEGQILRRGGVEPPEWEKWARKDVFRVGPDPDSTNLVEIAYRFREFAGTYMEHCHNTQHEDHAMLLRWDIEHPGQVKMMPTPIPTWDGVTYVDSVGLPTARTGDAVGQFGPTLDDQSVLIWVDGVEIGGVDLVDVELGDELNETDDERAWFKMDLAKGYNIDDDGVMREVYYFWHDVSDEQIAKDYGRAWGGGMADTPRAATSDAIFHPEDGTFTFLGDLPNPVLRAHPDFQTFPDSLTLGPPVSDTNGYSPLRHVEIDGKEVVINAFFVKWGDEAWEQLRIDVNCDPNDPTSFPDNPGNSTCWYNGEVFAGDAGHIIELNTEAEQPYVKFKAQKAYTDGGDYLPYYIVTDTWPAGPAFEMGVIYVPKHEFLAHAAVPLIQFYPPEPLNDSFPPTAPVPGALHGGGPLGGQIGMPSYFKPEARYSPMWHIGFAEWVVDDPSEVVVVKSFEQLKYLRSIGKIKINEFPPPPNQGLNNYVFDSGQAPHVVNCPVPATIDSVVHNVNKKIKQAILLAEGQ